MLLYIHEKDTFECFSLYQYCMLFPALKYPSARISASVTWGFRREMLMRPLLMLALLKSALKA